MKWNKEHIDSVLVKELSQRYQLSLLEASILVRRKITLGEDILFFLEKDFIYLHQPFMFKDMELAVDRIKSCKDDNEKVMVFGDRDVDGITSTVIIVQSLVDLGLETIWRVPTGTLGYGLSKDDIEFAKTQGVTLIITVDCGISSIEEAEFALSQGIDVLIFDHHVPGTELPRALAVIDAKIKEQAYPFDGICAAALSQKLRLALAISETDIYNLDTVLLNIVPLNGAYKFEIINVRNLVIQWRKSLTISPENSEYQLDEFVSLVEGKQIIVFNQPVQQKLLEQAFGKIEMYCIDLQELVNTHFKSLQNKSLLQIMSTVRLVKYLETELEEIDIFFQLYKTIIYSQYPNLKQAFVDVSDLVAIATIADLMPLTGENRILYKIGIEKLQNNPNKNLKVLLDKLEINSNEVIDSQVIGWKIAPIINSSGRMGKANIAVEMLLSEDQNIVENNAKTLIDLNQQRKKQMDSLRSKINGEVKESLEKNTNYVLIYNELLPHTFTGVVAGKYSREYGIPIIILAKRDDNVISGSIRCPASFNAPDMIQAIESYLIDGGGHKAAAGFSFSSDKKDLLLEELHLYLAKNTKNISASISDIFIDAEIPEKLFDPKEIIDMQTKLEPYGQSWDNIMFLVTNTSVQSCETVGAGKEHIKFVVKVGNFLIPAFIWQYNTLKANLNTLMHAKIMNLVCTFKSALYQGIPQTSLIIQDWEIVA